MYQHGIRIEENGTSMINPVAGTSGIQVIFGTAPINLVKDPYKCTNQLFLAKNFAEAKAMLGYAADFKNYTICQSIEASFKVFNIGPIIMCNVLDPIKHKKSNLEATYKVIEKQAVVNIKGILLDTVTVKGTGENDIYVIDQDYVLSFNDNGEVVVALMDGGVAEGVTELKIASSSIDPSAVKENDLIGGVDVSTGAESGLELIRQVYPKFGLVPGLLIAPGWSHKPTISAVMQAKCEDINGIFTCETVIDINTSMADDFTKVKTAKKDQGVISKHAIAVYPKIKIKETEFYYSALWAALTSQLDSENDNCPYMSPSNKNMNIDATILEGGKEIYLDQLQANTVNSYGVVAAVNINGWKAWGNNTAIYPNSVDPKDRWIPVRRFFSWWGNSFILNYASKVDDPTNDRLIQAICDSENISGNSYVSQGKLAGCKIIFNSEENSKESVLAGRITFRQYIAPYTPAEDICNILEFDPNMIASSLGLE